MSGQQTLMLRSLTACFLVACGFFRWCPLSVGSVPPPSYHHHRWNAVQQYHVKTGQHLPGALPLPAACTVSGRRGPRLVHRTRGRRRLQHPGWHGRQCPYPQRQPVCGCACVRGRAPAVRRARPWRWQAGERGRKWRCRVFWLRGTPGEAVPEPQPSRSDLLSGSSPLWW